MSRRSFHGTAVPFASALVAAVAVLGVLGSAPEAFGLSGFFVRGAAASDTVRAQEWWLGALQAPRAWRQTEGSGITVAVLGTGVAAGHPDLSGSVISGPDDTGSGRVPGGLFWGMEGTAVAAVIAGHGHGAGGGSGIIGIAPKARILSVRVTLEFNDPLVSDQAIARRLPDAIAAGIRYAADHGARVIDLPLDPGTLGLAGHGDPAAAGGSAAERAAVTYALSKNDVLVAPAGDDGQGPGMVNYPAAYPGVIAVGATGRNGQLALFSSRHSYASLTAPGADLVAAAPPGGYTQISTTGMASGLVAGTAALLLARFPHLSAAQVTQALTESTAIAAAAPKASSAGTTETAGASLPPLPARSAGGAGYGMVNVARAVAVAAFITSPRKPAAPRTSATPPARPARPAQRAAASPAKATASALAGSLVKYVVAGLAGLIVLLTGLLVLMRSRRARGRAAGTTRARSYGLHEHRKLPAASVPGHDPAEADPPTTADSPAAGALPAGGVWQGSSLGEAAATGSFRPAIAPVSRSTVSRSTVSRSTVSRAGRGAGGSGRPASPPWEPASPPERMPGPLPVVSRSAFPQSSGPGIRVPRDMTALPAARADAPRPPFGFTAPALPAPDAAPGFVAPDAGPGSTAAPDLPLPSAAPPGPAPATEFPTRPDLPAATGLPTQQSLDFAAAPVTTDYAPPPALADRAAPPLPADFTVHHEAPRSPFTTRPAVPDFTAPPPVPGPATPSVPGPVAPPVPGPAALAGTGTMPGAYPSGAPAAPDFPAPPATPDLTGSAPGAGASEPGPGQFAGASYLWDLAATDVFPVADSATPPPAPGAVPPREAPGASGG